MTRVLSFVMLVGALCMLGGQTIAAPFQDLFTLTRVTGDCKVEVPGEAPAQAEQGKVYPYGTKVMTGRKSSAVVEFSQGNECRVLASTTLTVTEDTQDKTLKVLQLAEGKLDIELEEGFHEHNSLNVETATAICGAIGCHFTADARRELDLEVALFNCVEGLLNLLGPDFEIPEFGADSSISVSGDLERTFTRLRVIRGQYDIRLRDSDGNPQLLEAKEGSVIKIWRRMSEDGQSVLVTIVLSDANGVVTGAFNFNVPTDQRPPQWRPSPGRRPRMGPGERELLDRERRLREESMRIRMELERLDRILREMEAFDREQYERDLTPTGRR